jgi:hypothetical protein
MTNVAQLESWLVDAAQCAADARYVVPPREPRPADTLYLWLNGYALNPDRWFLDPMAADHTRLDKQFPAPWSNRIGDQLGDLKFATFTVEGLEPLQEAFTLHGDDWDDPGFGAAARAVFAMVCAGVDEALRRAGELGLRVALSHGSEPRVVTWEHDAESGWSSEAHTS